VVRLRPGDCLRFDVTSVTFNPTVVQLRRNYPIFIVVPYKHFQSHCSAIATERWTAVGVCKNCFQSHCGAIATAEHNPLGEHIAFTFNPTVVRLRHVIATCAKLVRRAFNPTVVRLRLDPGDSRNPPSRRLSIPLWCDCDFCPLHLSPHPRHFQSHCGAIATQM